MGASPISQQSRKPNAQPAAAKPKLGLRAWMHRVLEECDRAAGGFDAEAVHDLRVALRRCRSLADGLRAIDPDSSWKDMKKSGKKLFQALGELRDMQVMQEWIEKLGDAADPAAIKLLDHVRAREAECKQHAFKDLNQFDRKQWRQWSQTLPLRASRVRPGSVVYLHLALEKWTAAYELHKRALRTRSQAAFHELRIGIKRFRYTVENFLPQQHAKWGDDLKELQDLLGEVHDLDVLWATALDPKVGAFPDAESRQRWHEKLAAERARRIARYREKMVGKQSLWRVWREELPAGLRLRAAALTRLKTWASYLDPDFAHSQRVAQLALLLYDGLQDAQLLRPQAARESSDLAPREVLQAAALMQGAGKVKDAENYQKISHRMIRSLPRPLGCSPRELELAAVVARYHRGALPRPGNKTMQPLALPDRRLAMQLSGILRLANALDHPSRNHPTMRGAVEPVPRLELSAPGHSVVVRVAGYSPLDPSAERTAGARHLLETMLRRPVIVRPQRAPAGNGRSRQPVT